MEMRLKKEKCRDDPDPDVDCLPEMALTLLMCGQSNSWSTWEHPEAVPTLWLPLTAQIPQCWAWHECFREGHF